MESRLEKAIKKLTELGLIDSFIENKLEQSYVDQLKKEAFERFGEIKHKDNFIAIDGKNRYQIPSNQGFRYFKNQDILRFSGICIYQQGKWAERVKERVEVIPKKSLIYHLTSPPCIDVEFYTSIPVEKSKAKEICKFLAEQLEKYLNNEL